MVPPSPISPMSQIGRYVSPSNGVSCHHFHRWFRYWLLPTTTSQQPQQTWVYRPHAALSQN